MTKHLFAQKLFAAILLVSIIGETIFATPAMASTGLNLPVEELDMAELLITEDAHLSSEDCNMDIQIPLNTMVVFSTEKTISSKNDETGSEIPLRVVYDVVIDGQVVIPAGSMATGRVLKANKAKSFGKPGYLSIGVESIDVDGGFIAVSGPQMTDEGDSRATVSWVCFGVCLVILWPLIFVPFCVKGTEAEIAAGTRLSAYTASQVSQRTYTLPVTTD